MGKPKGVYLVAFWIFFGFGSLLLMPILKSVIPKITTSPQLISLTQVFGLIFIIFLTTGVALVKPIPRLLTVVVFALSCLYQIFGVASFLIFAELANQTTKVVLFKLSIILPTAACIYYLLSSKFREKADAFLIFKAEEEKRKYSQKQLSKGL